MKILYFMRNFANPSPGAQRASYRIFKAIATENHDFQFVIVSNGSTKPSKVLGTDSTKHLVYTHKSLKLGIPGLDFLWENFLAEQLMQNVKKKTKPDLVHVQGYAGFYPRPPAGVPSILTFHDFPPWAYSDRPSLEPTKIMDFLWYKKAKQIRLKNMFRYTHFHAMSTQIKNYLRSRGIPSERITMVLNGVNHHKSENFKPHSLKKKAFRRKIAFSNDNILILMIGTIESRKGIHLAKAALDFLPTNYHIALIGGKSRLGGSYYLKKILTGKNSSRIHYFGHIPSRYVSRILSLADCYLSTSLSEACQVSVLEAINCEIPTVLTNVGAATDIFGINYPFLVSNPRPELLASKIHLAVSSSEKMSPPINSHTWNVVGKALGDFYRRIVENSR